MKRRKTLIHLEFSEHATADLIGRQSVRTTFKLSQRSINALSVLAGQLGIKQKSLFDHLVEDTQALQLIAKEIKDFENRGGRVAKTYVVSRKSLDNLERVSLQSGTPRDALVEFSIERILPLLAKEKEKHRKRKELLEELEKYIAKGLNLLEKSEKELGPEDPAFHELLEMIRSSTRCFDNIKEVVQKGSKIEAF